MLDLHINNTTNKQAMMNSVKNIAIIAKANNKFDFWYNAYDGVSPELEMM